ncbi:MAG: ethanolamine ammonia-lyase subunit EutC [Niabella sp.]
MSNIEKYQPETDPWAVLKSFTDARIALGRTGVSVPLTEALKFKLSHALARDAVFLKLDPTALAHAIENTGLQVVSLQSEAANRNIYLQRPDLGRKLHHQSKAALQERAALHFDIAICVADGLSPLAIERHAIPVLTGLIPPLQEKGFSMAPVSIIEQGRVAIADEVGALLNAKLSLILIGERPGLTSPDSMGAYITFNPAPGLTDEARNCISNIRPKGLAYTAAVSKIMYIINEAFRLQLSGVQLKDKDAPSQLG